MTIRSIALGLLLGLFVSVTAHFNDLIVKQALVIYTLLPISVIGAAVFMLMVVNPALRAFGARGPLRGSEIAVMVAIALASCGWPGAGFYRHAAPNIVRPAVELPAKQHWQAANVMSFVPDASMRLGPGQVRDWGEMVEFVLSGRETDGPPPARAIWSALDGIARASFIASGAEEIDPTLRGRLRAGFNRMLSDGELIGQPWLATLDLPDSATQLIDQADQRTLTIPEREHVGRWILIALQPDNVLPPPRGTGVLFDHGHADPKYIEPIMYGSGEPGSVALGDIPWDVWWPNIRLWGTLGLVMGLSVFCLAAIVHPQWSQREMLPYPIARFIEELTETDSQTGLSTIFSRGTFWIAFAAVFAFHLLNGLHGWFPDVPAIPRRIQASQLAELLPEASRIREIRSYFNPLIIPTVIAFGFFVNRTVSFTLGITPLCYGILVIVAAAYDTTLERRYLGAGQNNMLRFGAWAGMALMILYTGRRYYWSLLVGSVGIPSEAPARALWLTRLLIVLFVGAVLLLTSAGLPWSFAAVTVALLLLTFLVLSRIVAETGMFFIQPAWMPVAVVTGLFGFDVVGPTTYIVMAMASIMIVGDVRSTLMGHLINAFKIADDQPDVRIGRLSPWVVVMIVGGFFVAGAATFYYQYNYGMMQHDWFSLRHLPSFPFDELADNISDASARGTIGEAVAADGRWNLDAFRPANNAWWWAGGGLAAVLIVAFGRLRFAHWPIHPVLFLIWGTFGSTKYAASILIGWLVKVIVVRMAGTRGVNRAIPVMVGLVVGDIAGGFLWIGVGGVYYLLTGRTPPEYQVF